MRVYTGPCDVLEQPRVLPGYRAAPAPVADFVIHEVSSDSEPGVYRKVRVFSDGTMSCDCPDFEYRGQERPCKHIHRVQVRQCRCCRKAPS